MTDLPAGMIGKEMTQILAGLRPRLVTALASLDGSTLNDLNVSIQSMSYGDRITLAAYELVLIEEVKGNRKYSALPKLVQVVRAAAVSRSTWPDFEWLGTDRLEMLRQLKGLSADERQSRIQSMGLGTRLGFEKAGLIRLKDTEKDFFTVTLLPQLQVAIDLLTYEDG